MRISKKWFAVALALGASSGLVACGGSTSDAPPAATPATPSADPSASAAPSASEAAAAAPTAVAPAPPPGPGPALTVVAMKLLLPKKGQTLDLKADSTMLLAGKPGLKVVGHELLDEKGRALLSVFSDGSVKFAMEDKPWKFNDKDELVDEKGGRIVVGDDGVVQEFDAAGAPTKHSGVLKFVGFKPAARRAAAFMAVMGMLGLAIDEMKASVKKKH